MTRTVHRVCTLCEANCGLRFEVDGERIVRVRPDDEDPFSRGYACPKGIAIAQVHDDPDRLRTPVRRTPAGDFEPIGWEEALAFAGDGLRRVRDAGGRDAVGLRRAPCAVGEQEQRRCGEPVAGHQAREGAPQVLGTPIGEDCNRGHRVHDRPAGTSMQRSYQAWVASSLYRW